MFGGVCGRGKDVSFSFDDRDGLLCLEAIRGRVRDGSCVSIPVPRDLELNRGV